MAMQKKISSRMNGRGGWIQWLLSANALYSHHYLLLPAGWCVEDTFSCVLFSLQQHTRHTWTSLWPLLLLSHFSIYAKHSVLLLWEEQCRNKGEAQKHKGEEEESKKQRWIETEKETYLAVAAKGLIRRAKREQAHAFSSLGLHCYKKPTLLPTTNYYGKVVRKIQQNVNG